MFSSLFDKIYNKLNLSPNNDKLSLLGNNGEQTVAAETVETVTNRQKIPTEIEKKAGIAQGKIYQFLLDLLKYSTPEDVLEEFQRLFLEYAADDRNCNVLIALSDLIFLNQYQLFINTLKQSCYIIINKWINIERNYPYIVNLINSIGEFKDITPQATPSGNLILNRLDTWLNQFANSKDYQELKVFANHCKKQQNQTAEYKNNIDWVSHYTFYLLTPQYYNINNSIEHRQSAMFLAKYLQDKFKFELATYTSKIESKVTNPNLNNPTILGDEVLILVKKILLIRQKNQVNYSYLSKVFLDQTLDKPVYKFKNYLVRYLTAIFTEEQLKIQLQKALKAKLDNLYSEYNEAIITQDILVKICNKVVELFITENQKNPSGLFIMLVSHRNPLFLSLLLLKIILISPKSRIHIEICLSKLLDYYSHLPREQCQWFMYFLDVFNVTLAIYTEDRIKYDLVKINFTEDMFKEENLAQYRIFAHIDTSRIKVY